MKKLSKPQQTILSAMELNRWYNYYELPLVTGHTYLALERKGFIISRRSSVVGSFTRYTPYKWNHQFMVTAKGKAHEGEP